MKLYDFIVSLYYEIRFQLLTRYWNFRSRNSRINGKVYVFHHVTDDFVDTYASCKCTIERFRQFLDESEAEGRKIVSIDEAMELIERGSSKPFTVITFDDINEDAFLNAFPILIERNIPFTSFLTPGLIGQKDFINQKQFEELKEISLCTIGAHTMTHPQLRKSLNSYDEIRDSKNHLEECLNTTIKYMAYPYGQQSTVSSRNIQEAKTSGYKCAFSTIPAPISEYTCNQMYFLPRLTL